MMKYTTHRWQTLAGIATLPAADNSLEGSPVLLREVEEAETVSKTRPGRLLQPGATKVGPPTEDLNALKQAFSRSWSWIGSKLGPYLDPVFTFASGGGPGAGVVLKDPIPGTTWDDALFAFDMDVTGPGTGVVVSPDTAANWIEMIPQEWAKTTGDAVRRAPGKVYLGLELVGVLPVPFVGLAGNEEDKDKILEFIETSSFGKWVMSKTHALESLSALPPNKVYDDLDSLWSYTVIDGVWHARRQDAEDVEWISFETLPEDKREQAESILDSRYPDALELAAEREAAAVLATEKQEEDAEIALEDLPDDVGDLPDVEDSSTSFLWKRKFRQSKSMLALYVAFRKEKDPTFFRDLGKFGDLLREKDIDLEDLSLTDILPLISAFTQKDLNLSHLLFSGIGELKEDLETISPEEKEEFEEWFAVHSGLSSFTSRDERRKSDTGDLIDKALHAVGFSPKEGGALDQLLSFAAKLHLI